MVMGDPKLRKQRMLAWRDKEESIKSRRIDKTVLVRKRPYLDDKQPYFNLHDPFFNNEALRDVQHKSEYRRADWDPTYFSWSQGFEVWDEEEEEDYFNSYSAWIFF